MSKIPSLLPKEITSQVSDTWLSARAIQCAGVQASGLVRAVKTKTAKALKRRGHLVKERKSLKKIDKQITKLLVAKPEITKLQPQLSAQCARVDRNNETSFETWVTIHSISNGMKIILPAKGSKHLDELLTRGGKILNSVRVSNESVYVSLEMPPVPLKTEGKTVGMDLGVTEMFVGSDGQREIADKDGHTLSSIMETMKRRKNGSKGFERAQAHRESHINWAVKQINLDGVSQVNLEDLKGVRKNKINSRKMNRWTYGTIRRGVERLCAKNGVRTVRVNPNLSSQRCNQCGWTQGKNRCGKRFLCISCGHGADADENASLNLVVNLPKVTGQQWSRNRDGNGFFWIPTKGQEPMVPGGPRVRNVSSLVPKQ